MDLQQQVVLQQGHSIKWKNITAPFIHSEEVLIYNLVRVSSILSLFGSLFVLFTWYAFKDIHFFSRKLIVYTSIADICSSMAFLYGTFIQGYKENTHASTQCVVQGILIQFFYLASYFWTGNLAIHLYQILINKIDGAERLEIRYHLLGWGVPLGICIYLMYEEFLLHEEVFGGAQRPWCWIENHSSKNLMWTTTGVFKQFIFFYVPQVLVFAMNACIYSILISKVKGSVLGEKMRKRLLWYLLSFLIVAIWGILHRTYQVLVPDHHPNFYLSIIESFFSPLQGFLNAIVYGTSKKIGFRYMQWFTKDNGDKEFLNNLTRLDDTNDSSMHISFLHNESYNGDNNTSFSSIYNKGSPPSLVSDDVHLHDGDARYRPLIDPVATVASSGHQRQMHNGIGNLENNSDIVEGHSFVYIPRRLNSPKKKLDRNNN